ncbi:GNAT family N-acetyltransferase [Rathayibacter sp. YIM 133350]|uniref:GNAT family N-acetyltransferase n=1 Tax=Rathayibacter sp. YIM 133350 TaxID=3131992 RepID=UPI00307D366F
MTASHPSSIRLATPADTDALAELAEATFALACPPGTTPDAVSAFLAANLSGEHFARYLAEPHRTIVVAEHGGAAVGYSMLVFGEPYDADAAAAIRIRPTVELSKFYTRAQAHGSGIAALLMSATLDAARERDAVGIWLGVNEQNARAIRFYEKNGFQRVGAKRFLVGERLENDFVMERPLN